MDITWYVIKYKDERGSEKTEMFPTVLQRLSRINELRALGVEFEKETQQFAL